MLANRNAVRSIVAGYRRLQDLVRRRIDPAPRMISPEFEDEALAVLDDERVNAAVDQVERAVNSVAAKPDLGQREGRLAAQNS